MIEPTCTEAAPCFACLRCFVALTNTLATDPNVRAHMTGIETRPAWEPAWKHAAEANGLLPSADAYRVGPLSTERTITLTAAHVATLPTGERVELPAGTVLREGAGAIDHRHLLACARGVVDHDAAQALTGPVAHALLSALRVACGDSIEDVAQRAGPLEPMSPAWINAQFREVTQAEGEAILADLTERAGLPREMAPSVLRVDGVPVAEVTSITFERTVRAENVPPGMLEDGSIFATVAPSAEVPDEHGYLDGYPSTESPPANLDPTERETPPPIPFAEAHETRAERAARLRDAMGSPVEADPDPIAALTLAAQEDAARKAAHLGRPTYDRARGRISFGPVEVVEAPDLEASPPKPRT